jgi:hypothetical protein
MLFWALSLEHENTKAKVMAKNARINSFFINISPKIEVISYNIVKLINPLGYRV